MNTDQIYKLAAAKIKLSLVKKLRKTILENKQLDFFPEEANPAWKIKKEQLEQYQRTHGVSRRPRKDEYRP